MVYCVFLFYKQLPSEGCKYIKLKERKDNTVFAPSESRPWGKQSENLGGEIPFKFSPIIHGLLFIEFCIIFKAKIIPSF